MISCLSLKQSKGFECTGSDESHVWNHLHKKVPGMFNCQGICREHYEFLAKGLHDHVNLGLGKNAYDKKTYLKFVHEINVVAMDCKRDGRC